MSRFTWWTLVWQGLGLAGFAVRLHYFGSVQAFSAYYGDGVIFLAAIIDIALWIGLWHAIIKHEPSPAPHGTED